MQFLDASRRKPMRAFLAAVLMFALLYAGYQFFPGLARNAFDTEQAAQAPAGIRAVEISGQNLSLSGWAPAHSAVQIGAPDKDGVAADADDSGRWTALVPVEWRAKNLQSFKASWQQKDVQPETLGQVFVYAPGKPADGVYAWLENPEPVILLAPEGEEGETLYVVLSRFTEGEPALFAGHGAPGSVVQIYQDGELAATAAVAANGYWSMALSLKPGKKNLRFDDVGPKQIVLDRRAYAFDPNDEQGADYTVLRADKETVLLWKPEAGEASPPDALIAGQILPLLPGKQAR